MIGRHHHSFCAVPVDRVSQALLERDLWRPAERLKLGGVQRISAVVARAILDVTDQRLGLAEQLEDPSREVGVPDVIAAADVVDLAAKRHARSATSSARQ